MIIPAGVLVSAPHARLVAVALRRLGRDEGGLPEWAVQLVAELDAAATSVATSGVGTSEPATDVPRRILSNVTHVGTEQAAQRLGVSDSYVRRLIRDGALDAERVGAGYAIALADVTELASERNRT